MLGWPREPKQDLRKDCVPVTWLQVTETPSQMGINPKGKDSLATRKPRGGASFWAGWPELRAITSDPLSFCPSILPSAVHVILKPGSLGSSRLAASTGPGFCLLILGLRDREGVLSFSHSAKLQSSYLVGLAQVM